MSKLTIALAQLNLKVGDIAGNCEKILETTRDIEQSVDLVVFPELALTGYPPEDLLLREECHQRCEASLERLQSESSRPHLLLGHPQRRGDQLYNTASHIQPGSISQYDKQCLPNHTVFDEKRYFSPGQKPHIITINNIQLGILICEDLWQPEPIISTIAAGADLIICINASPFAHDKLESRQKLLTLRSQEHAIPILYTNLVGGQDELVFDGGSAAVDSQGKLLLEAAYFEEDTLIVSVEKNNDVCLINPISKKSHTPPPQNRYLPHIYQALVLGVRDYINKNHFDGAIIGLSGGIDSALTLAIAYDALGPERLHVLSMPSRYTAETSNNDAATMASLLQVKHQSLDIEPAFQSFLDIFDQQFNEYPQSIASENIQARIRGNLLMALSNMTGKIVLTTGNRSELAVGYCTLYGDMAGGFAVIKDIPKTTVYKLCQYRNSLSEIIPQAIIDRPPTAELRENQLDQDSLPPYPILDQIIDLYINQGASIESLYETNIDHETVNHVVKLINKNEHKRRQAPIGVRISEHAFGRDRRYPITSGF